MNSVNKAKEMASIREGIHKIIEDALFFFQRDYDFLSLFFLEPKAIHTKIALEKGGNLFNCMDAIIKDIKVIFKKGIEKAEIKSYDPVILSYFLIGFLHTFAMHSKIDPKKGAKVLTEIFFEGIKNYPEKIS